MPCHLVTQKFIRLHTERKSRNSWAAFHSTGDNSCLHRAVLRSLSAQICVCGSQLIPFPTYHSLQQIFCIKSAAKMQYRQPAPPPPRPTFSPTTKQLCLRSRCLWELSYLKLENLKSETEQLPGFTFVGPILKIISRNGTACVKWRPCRLIAWM